MFNLSLPVSGTRGLLLASAMLAAGPLSAAAQEALASPVARSKIEDVIVTAQRRSERNQNVPISITTFSNKQLSQQNITKAQDLSGSVPSLTVGANGQGSRETQAFTVRGIGSSFEASPGVITYFAEVPLPSPISLSQQGGPGNFIDLQNVQVLEGPQGTLFGRNTTGGAVLLVPTKPSNKYEGYFDTRFTNYNGESFEGMVNVPIIPDKLLLRVDAARNTRSGYTYDTTTQSHLDNQDWSTFRASLTFRPTESFENYLIGYGTYSNSNGTGLVNEGFNIPALEAIGFCKAPCSVYANATAKAQALGPRTTETSLNPFQWSRTFGVIDNARYQLADGLALRNIFSFQTMTLNYAYDGDGTPLQQNDTDPNTVIPGYHDASHQPHPRDDIQDITEELQLQGNALNNKLIYTAGAFYYDQKPQGPWASSAANYCPAAETGFCPNEIISSSVSNRSEAVYVQDTLDLGLFTPTLDRLKLTTGFRYTWDQIQGSATSYQALQTVPGYVFCDTTYTVVSAQDVGKCGFNASLSTRSPSWLVSLDYRLNSNLLAYAKITQGYKSGGFNPYAVRATTETFQPENVTSFEGGLKSDFQIYGVPLRLNGDYYWMNYLNIQRAASDLNPVTGASGAEVLGAKAHIQGLELEGTIKPLPSLEIGGNLSYVDAHYKHYTYTASGPTLACNGFVSAGGTANAACLPLNWVTPTIFSLHATYTVPIEPDYGNLSLFVSYNHNSAQHTESLVVGQPFEKLQSYGLLNLSLDWTNIFRSRFDLGVFGTNVTNKLYRISNTDVFQSLLYAGTIYGEPAIYGVHLRYHF